MALPKHKKRLSASLWRKRANKRKFMFQKWRKLNELGEVSEGMQKQINIFMVRKY
tara:strand:+ start:213 stop:377 length:165 start_codon:yes stop_codon:yes gene_type:complete